MSEELVRRRELDVAPYVGEELRQLRLDGRDDHHLFGQPPEQRLGPQNAVFAEAGDDLRQLGQLLHREAFGDALGAEGDLDVLAPAAQPVADLLADPREDGAAQDEELSVAQVRQVALQHRSHRVELGVQVTIDRRADDDHHRVGLRDGSGVERERELAGLQGPLQRLFRSLFLERHLPVADGAHRRRVDVERADRGAAIGQRDRQRQPDVAESADDDRVVLHGFFPAGSFSRMNCRLSSMM
jgi:hypothetical protein